MITKGKRVIIILAAGVLFFALNCYLFQLAIYGNSNSSLLTPFILLPMITGYATHNGFYWGLAVNTLIFIFILNWILDKSFKRL